MKGDMITDFFNDQGDRVDRVEAMPGGANNQGYKVTLSNGRVLFLKAFSPQCENSIIKLKREFHFSQHMTNQGMQFIPKPLMLCESRLFACYEFINGSPVERCGLDEHCRAMKLVALLCDDDNIEGYKYVAAESPKCLSDFYHVIDSRLQLFRKVTTVNSLGDEFYTYLDTLERAANQTYQSVLTQEFWHQTLDVKVLSPSDFGFHNAIKRNHELFFIDFEYAGIDSPWKLVADYFSQPAIPLPIEYIMDFIELPKFCFILERKEHFLKVMKLTMIKWCLIMLNEFKQDTLERRQFAWNNSCFHKISDEKGREQILNAQCKQLAKSKAYFEVIDARLEKLSQLLHTRD